ncbi:MAG: phosphate ABC transporter permease PstA [Rhodobacteraceae bacterium]|nr:phosphate ABC transporter permease PstA [Paracoccaceae bacterium]
MTDIIKTSLLAPDARTQRRNAAEHRFRIYGMVAVGLGMVFLVALLWAIVSNGTGAFTQTYVTLNVHLLEEKLDPEGTRDPAEIASVTTFGYGGLIDAAMVGLIEEQGIQTDIRPKKLDQILSSGAAAQIRRFVLDHPEMIGQDVEFRLLASSRADGYLKGRVTRESLARDKNMSREHLDLLDNLIEAGIVERVFNMAFITGADASESRPEQAGIGVSMIGSFYMMLVVLLCALPLGVAAALYLEEFAPKNWFTDILEVNISNLAAVPSIVFGILGLAAFIQFAHLPQSAPIVGGLVLTLMTLPRIIIPARAALGAVPPSIREAALGVGASRNQCVFHHVLPLAMPGILTGIIIGMAQALGETAPLLLIGMVGFIAANRPDGIASGLLDPNSAMPAQIYEWAKRADPAYIERAWGGIIVLLVCLMVMNIIAVILRRRFERRW